MSWYVLQYNTHIAQTAILSMHNITREAMEKSYSERLTSDEDITTDYGWTYGLGQKRKDFVLLLFCELWRRRLFKSPICR